jgi:Retroviral aspartyl protease
MMGGDRTEGYQEDSVLAPTIVNDSCTLHTIGFSHPIGLPAAEADTTADSIPPVDIPSVPLAPIAQLNAQNDVSLASHLMVFDGYLGHRPAKVLVDSGSTKNFVSRRFAEAVGFKLTRVAPFHVTLADGSTNPVSSMLKSAHLKLGRYRDKVSLDVVALDHYDVILGTPWLSNTSAKLDFATFTIAMLFYFYFMLMLKLTNMYSLGIFVLIASFLLDVLTRLFTRSNPVQTSTCANASALTRVVDNPLFLPSPCGNQRYRREKLLFFAGLPIPKRTSPENALRILQDFLSDRFALENCVLRVLKFIPGVPAKRSILIAQVDGPTFHQLLLWKNAILKGSSITIDVPRMRSDLRRRFTKRSVKHHQPSERAPQSTGRPTARNGVYGDLRTMLRSPPQPHTIVRRANLSPMDPNLPGFDENGPAPSIIPDPIPTALNASTPAPSEDEVDPEKEYEADCILGQRREGRVLKYLVKFVGSDTHHWCNADDVGPGLLDEWWAAHPEYRPKPRTRPTLPPSSSNPPPTTSQPQQPTRRSARIASQTGGPSQSNQ